MPLISVDLRQLFHLVWVKVKDVADPLFWALSFSAFKKHALALSRQIDSIPEVCRKYRGFGWYRRIPFFQNRKEFSDLIRFCSQLNPDTTIEIGTAFGATLLLWARVTQSLVISIDDSDIPRKRHRLFQSFPWPNSQPRICPLPMNSLPQDS